jgi:hypothetical protein
MTAELHNPYHLENGGSSSPLQQEAATLLALRRDLLVLRDQLNGLYERAEGSAADGKELAVRFLHMNGTLALLDSELLELQARPAERDDGPAPLAEAVTASLDATRATRAELRSLLSSAASEQARARALISDLKSTQQR